MKLIELTKGYWAIVDDRDYEWLMQWKWHSLISNPKTGLYVLARRTHRSNGTRTTILMHRAIWERHNGPIPEDMSIDHIEHGEFAGLDNRLCNLRLADRSLQGRNTRARVGTTSSYRGVTWAKREKVWRARVNHCDRKDIHLGFYDDEVDAALVVDRAHVAMYGDLARLNFPELKEKWIGVTFDDVLSDVENNVRDRRSRMGYKYLGVWRLKGSRKNPWSATVTINKKHTHIGCYPTEEDAARAFDAYVIAHNLDKRLNFPENPNSEV